MFAIILLIIVDQGLKYFFIEYFREGGKSIEVFSFLRIVYLWNKGVSFGMFSQFEYSNHVFTAFSSIITIILIYLFAKTEKKLEAISYSLIISGAIANIMDRISYGAVFDFIYFYVGDFHWPAFNIADSNISIGVVLFLINIIFYDKQNKLR